MTQATQNASRSHEKGLIYTILTSGCRYSRYGHPGVDRQKRICEHLRQRTFCPAAVVTHD